MVKAIILNKVKFKEKDIICLLLLENGSTASCLFYGGAGGGEKRKSSILEIGFVLEIKFNQIKKEINSDMLSAKEYQLVWGHQQIRNQYTAFCLLSFYVELISKIAHPVSKNDLEIEHHPELFIVASNSIFYLDAAANEIENEKLNHLSLFLVKVCHAMGIFPETGECLYCGADLSQERFVSLQKQDGGFSCMNCLQQKMETEENIVIGDDNRTLLNMFVSGAKTLYKNHQLVKGASSQSLNDLLEYLFFQFHFQKASFKTLHSIL